ncbi:GNAT family N-acetyltransferase [Actinacidiphila bryophytorum]|uniref:Protein N-acetyltransferase, RimJ/RimL family n=1 Tax=Actinacidiphila bryophytorum TaxID=1436133 RepID=A0A9W4H5C8_9ACTN|nr:GNAT family protein [Actinacidiphila bryophytorum]MBM9439629.1 GNAT family N-acetyltransferase [Actinacidiphila bryophytorum]MBN6547458.1 GNAT family N-acetyltransferase [Actinacidiphila bryophytorum]CAG7653246.1 Protein N-acetyltransferase, RimJ/RimL family [Actinacidiphila bryophytorum]
MVAKSPVHTVLEGRHVRLEPLDPAAHSAALFAAGGGDEEVWRWLPVEPPRSEEEIRQLAGRVVAGSEESGGLAFAVVERAGGRAVGWTTYCDVSTVDERLEIGWTWYGRDHWRTAVNTEAKLLLMGHAFDDLGYGRICWKTDRLNTRSQQAIARLGAVREGVWRRHRLRSDGVTWRDSVFFSMLADEWPDARQRLRARLVD